MTEYEKKPRIILSKDLPRVSRLLISPFIGRSAAHEKDLFTIWSMALFFGWVLSFPYYGSVLKTVSHSLEMESGYFTFAFLLFHALGYLTGALILKQVSRWKYLMIGSLIAVIAMNMLLWFIPPAFWRPVMALLGFISAFYILGWSCIFYPSPSGQKVKLMADIIIGANIITLIIMLLSSYLAPFHLLAVKIIPLFLALALLYFRPPKERFALTRVKKAGRSAPAHFIAVMVLFIALLHTTAGFMYTVVYECYTAMASNPFALTYFKYLPYLVTVVLILKFTTRLNQKYMAYFGVSLLGLAFVLFALLEDSITGFYLTTTALEAAFALIAVFLWVLLGDLSLQYGAPYLFFGYGLFANVIGTFTGGLYGDNLLRKVESPQLLTALYALAAIFAALVAVPWLVEKANAGSPGAASQDDLPPLSLLPENTLLEALALEAGLTARETEVVKLLLRGYPNRTISQQLFISENTLKTHLRNIYPKFGVRNKSELQIRVAGRTAIPAPASPFTVDQ